jgi:hypothetical protein
MKNITGLVILIVLVVVLLAVWGKIFPTKEGSQGKNLIGQGTQDWVQGVTTGTLAGVGNSVGGFEAGVANGVKVVATDYWNGVKEFWGGVFGTSLTPASGGATGPIVQGAPLPYGNPPAGTDQPVDSSDFGGDFLPQAWPPQ